MEYAEIQHAAKQAKSLNELCLVNEKVEQLFWEGKLKMTDENWHNFNKVISEVTSELSTRYL